MVEFLNINIPTVPITNKGPELLVKLSSLSHSSLVQILFCLKLVAIFAPTGYPLIIPIIKAKEHDRMNSNIEKEGNDLGLDDE